MKIEEYSPFEYHTPRQVWLESLDYLKRIGALYVDKYIPYYLSSIGAHVANLKNKLEPQFYGVAGGVPDLRLHLLMIAPPGYSKSFFPNHFFSGNFGIASSFPNVELGIITEAGLIGSIDVNGGKINGLAELHKEAVIWSEEFSAQTQTMKQEHSVNLDTALLKLLDDGKVEKRLAKGSIEFTSYMTMWGGTQNERLDLASGLARRLFILDATPDRKDQQNYVEGYRASRGIRQNWAAVNELRKQFKYLYEHFQVPGKIIFDPSYDELAYNMNMTHIEIILFEKLAIGYNVMTNYKYGDEDLIIRADDKLKHMFREAWVWRNIMMGESENVQILKLVRTQDWPLTILKKRLQSLGIHFQTSTDRINKLCARDVLKTEKRPWQEKANKPGRPVLWVTKGPQWWDWMDELVEEKKEEYNDGFK